MQTRKQSKERSKDYSFSYAKQRQAYSRDVIFPMQPSTHWLAHVGEDMVHEKHSQYNQQT